jgi:hypothetical protein
VRWFDEDEGVDVLVEHGKHLQTILRERVGRKNSSEQPAAEPLTFHEIRSSTIRYDVMTGFVKVTGEEDRDKEKLKELFATHALKRADFFNHADSRNLYTLGPVVEQGRNFQLQRGPDESLLRWAVREIQFDEGERLEGRRKRRPRWWHTHGHVQNAVAHLGESMPDLDWRAVRFTYMKIWLEYLLDGRKRPASLTLKPPGILRGPQGKLEPHIMEFLRYNGLSRPHRPPAAAAAAD